MREEMIIHKIVFGLVAAWLVIFLVILLLLDVHHYTARLEAEILLVVSITLISALGYVGLAEIIVGFQFGVSHRRELVTYLLLGTFSLLSGILLALATEVRLPVIAFAISPHAFLFGWMQLRIAAGLSHHPTRAWSLRTCGAIEIVSGILLLCSIFLSNEEAVRLLGTIAASTLLQIVSFLLFPKRIDPSRSHAERP